MREIVKYMDHLCVHYRLICYIVECAWENYLKIILHVYSRKTFPNVIRKEETQASINITITFYFSIILLFNNMHIFLFV